MTNSENRTSHHRSSEYYTADADLWCENGHDPKIAKSSDSGFHECPECGAEFAVDLDVTVVRLNG